jgi:acyl dehydratase
VAVDSSLAGRTFAPTAAYVVSAERIAEFAVATGCAYDGGAAPATFPIVVAFRAMTDLLDDPSVGISLHRVVHGEQRFSYTRPVVAEDVLTATLTVEGVRSIGGADIITTRSEITDESGDHVVTARATLVHRAEAPETAPDRPAARPSEPGPERSTAGSTSWEAGAKLPVRDYAVTRSDLIRYAGASGDFNPIHWSDRVARSVGLPGVIAHGMFTMALAARALDDWAGSPGRVRELGAKFTNPVVVPDDDAGATVTVTGTVSDLDDGRASVSLEVTSGGTKVLGTPRAVVDLG